MRRRSGIALPFSRSGSFIGLVSRAASSFWPKNHHTRAAWAVS